MDEHFWRGPADLYMTVLERLEAGANPDAPDIRAPLAAAREAVEDLLRIADRGERVDGLLVAADIMRLQLDLGHVDDSADELICRLGEVVASVPPGSPGRPNVCLALAQELLHPSREPADEVINEAVELLREAYRETIEGDPETWAEVSYWLASALVEQAHRQRLTDRDEAIDLLEPAVELVPDASWAPAAVRMIASLYQERWDERRDPADLDASIRGLDRVAQVGEPEDVFLLGLALGDRWDERKNGADLDAAIDRLAAAVGASDALRLERLGELLIDRGNERRSTADLDAGLDALAAAQQHVTDDSARDDLLVLQCVAAAGRVGMEYDAGVNRLIIDNVAELRSRIDGDERLMLIALAAAARGEEVRRVPDAEPLLDAAVEAVDEACALLPSDHELAIHLRKEQGVLRGSRGQARADADDLRSGIALLTDLLPQWPADDPGGLAETAGALAAALATAATFGIEDASAYDRIVELLSTQDARSLPAGLRSLHNDVLGTTLTGRFAYSHDRADLDRGIALLQENDELVTDPLERVVLAFNIGNALQQRFLDGGELTDIDQAVHYLRRAAVHAPAWPAGSVATADAHSVMGMLATVEGIQATYRRDTYGLRRALADLEKVHAGMPTNHPRYAVQLANLGTIRQIYGGLAEDPAAVRLACDELVTAAGMTPRGHPYRGFHRMKAGAALVVESIVPYDRRGLGKAIDFLLESAEDPAISGLERTRLFMLLGNAYHQRFRHDRDATDLENAIDWLERGRAAAGEWPDFGLAATVELIPARAYRDRATGGRPERTASRTADARRARDHGMSALRAHLRQVLLQTGAEDGLHAAGDASAEAMEIATWCLADGEPDAAISALEVGRGLVLYAATTVTGIAGRLRAIGEDELVEDWDRSLAKSTDPLDSNGSLSLPITVRDDVRTRVIRALTRPGGDATRLLESPSAARIAAALRDTGSDALVYLIAGTGTEGTTGHAVIVPADGKPRVLPLPMLTTRPGDPLSAFIAAERARRDDRDASGGDGGDGGDGERDVAEQTWRRALDQLCDWAGKAAIRPVLAHAVLADAATRRSGVPRLVLVPVGRLGRVPWHAARLSTGRAVEHAVITCAATARQYVEIAARTPRPLTAEPVIVVNPTGDLLGAASDAESFVRCYPEATVLGIPSLAGAAATTATTAPGSPHDVLSRLPGAHGAGASVLHLACHGRLVDGHPARSYLMVADHSELSVSAILAQAQARPPEAPGGLIMPIACVSDLTDDAYDEVLAITTAFLAAGAYGVIGTLWNVMDHAASIMMYVFHRHLVTTECSPADALRHAQLWMLDPDRKVPGRMPIELAMAAGEPDLADVTAWAGFTYQGR